LSDPHADTLKKRVVTWLTHHAAAVRFSPFGPQAHLPINVMISCGRPLLAVASNPSHSCNAACWPEAEIDDPRNILRYPPPDPFQEPKVPDYDVVPIVELEWRSDMRQKLGHPLDCNCLGRRNFLKLTAGAVAGITGGGLFLANQAHADALSRELRDKLTPEQIIQAMKNGNKRFRRGERKERNYLREQKASAKGQYPAAVLLTCMDARAPAEVIMDLGIGDIFNCRVAGNVKNADILGSMEYACKLAGTKVVLVMGHTACGAIKGAIDNAELGNLTGLLAKIKPAIEATAYTGERSAKNYAFVDAVARKNVEMTVADIRKDSPVLAEMEAKGGVKMTGAMYNLETGAVEFFD
jgi:carbonic anhydrase